MAELVSSVPECNSPHTHHETSAVDVWQRDEDDDCVGYSIQPKGEGVKAIPGEGNPSSRRSGIRLHFLCESCSGRFAITISQDKGGTLVEVERD